VLFDTILWDMPLLCVFLLSESEFSGFKDLQDI